MFICLDFVHLLFTISNPHQTGRQNIYKKNRFNENKKTKEGKNEMKRNEENKNENKKLKHKNKSISQTHICEIQVGRKIAREF